MKIKNIKPVFEDERGSIWDFLTDKEINHIGYLITKKGSVRGKHYHIKQEQFTLVLKGKIRLTSRNLLEKNSPKEVVELKDMDIVFHPPYHYHAIEALENSKCLIFTSKGRSGSSYEDDTFRVDDIDSFNLSKD